ncbi:hypothetical protein CSOJ01_04368 [Colletotrichum sojae]|uniref:Uncharacterized protein n=1 Tax=Colletotrichum sojae TaxID=2175907 RepID=A0A8H6JJK7_9PEZI|nr:hypothetical protein CSOJ01_04368 [Colletotrichum sojae]
MAYDRDDFAPPGGWTEINQESLAALDKNDAVIDLLRHVPHVDGRSYPLEPFIIDDTPVVNYRSKKLQKEIREGEFTDITLSRAGTDPPLPPSSAAIAICSNRNGYEVILDTEDGHVYWGDPIGNHDEKPPTLNSTLEERFRGDAANEWRLAGFNVYEPAGLLKLCKERFRELYWIGFGPLNLSVQRGNMGWEYESEPDPDWSDPEDDFSHNRLARKMKKVGWPGDGEGIGWDIEKFGRLCGQ